MLNEHRNDRPGNARFYPCPSTIEAGDPVLIGGVLPAVALESYDAGAGGTTFRMSGSYRLTVIAGTVVSPITGSAVKPGEKIFATGTTDGTTGVIHDLTLSKASGGVLFGSYDGEAAITSGETDTEAPVMLKESV
jgi:predicted RecA/RadA family phage recombinase